MNQERAVPVMLIEDFQTGEEIDVDDGVKGSSVVKKEEVREVA